MLPWSGGLGLGGDPSRLMRGKNKMRAHLAFCIGMFHVSQLCATRERRKNMPACPTLPSE